ncbi:MAG: hypothetical protein KAR65_05310 [Anaerolineales bacterium]|nr:hypothetical protein [Anaerolineales bacterium]MCK5634713.1 hypothetical protein [Anaerolineales bacterium]
MDKRIINIAALNIFEGKLQVEAAILDEAFDNLDACVEKLELLDMPLSWIVAYTLKKAGSNSLTLYKMMIDGSVPQCRERINSMIESLELLIYIGHKSQRVVGKYPSESPIADETANISNDQNMPLWKSLNSRATQLGFSHESIQRVIHNNREQWGYDQPQTLENIQAKLKTLYRVLIRLIIEGATCLGSMNCNEEFIFFERLQAHIEHSYAVFGPSREGSNLPDENAA